MQYTQCPPVSCSHRSSQTPMGPAPFHFHHHPPQRVGTVAGADGGKSYVLGSEALAFRREGGMDVATPFGADDLIEDWDLAGRLVTYALKDRLRVDPKETALLLAEPTHITAAGREKAVEALFESQSCPALFLAKVAVLSAFAVGKQTALVVDAGYGGTTGETGRVWRWRERRTAADISETAVPPPNHPPLPQPPTNRLQSPPCTRATC